VSVEAISWALNLAPVPGDRGGQPSSACKFVLVGLANHAGPEGTGAFPSVATLVCYTGLSERTVRTCLGRLGAGGIIVPCADAAIRSSAAAASLRSFTSTPLLP
jgi:Helix-turn-helix domain